MTLLDPVDELFGLVRRGGREAFGRWMGRAERPIRASLRPFARAVDVESIVQETMLRMWILATRGERELVGVDSSLRFSIGLARNLARNEARRMGRMQYLPPEDLPEDSHEPAAPDPGLAAAIEDCLRQLTGKLMAVMRARIAFGGVTPDRGLASSLNMTPNTFLQCVVRARAAIKQCLVKKGVPLGEIGA